jgi:GTP-binding protein Era
VTEPPLRPEPAEGRIPSGSGHNAVDKPFRSGFACFVGRPNAGKSTLTNALVGSKIAIASSKPQTTRHAVRGIVHRPDAQLVLIDTPGLHKPRTLLGERLNDLVRTTWSEVDVVGVCLPANQRIGPGDGYLVGEIAALPRRPELVAIATKSDLATPTRMAEHLTAIAALEEQHGIRWAHIIPVSAVLSEGGRPPSDPPRRANNTRARAQRHDQTDVLADLLVSLLPPGPPLYPDGEITDEPTETLVAELIREAALEDVRDELPHSITVAVEEMGLREGRSEQAPLLDVYASMIVERDSQKGIVIGHRGTRLREIGAAARKQIEALLGTPVYLDLRVKVLKEWQRDPKHLNRLGF